MKKLAFVLFIFTLILLRPYVLNGGGFWYHGDDQDYFAHSASIVFGEFPSYQKEYLVIDKEYPQSSIGSGLLALPFVASFSLVDRLMGSSIVKQRTLENASKSWSLFGFFFASCFYFSCGCFLLYRGLLYCVENRYAFWAIFLTIICQGIPLYAYRRPVFSHMAEFFLHAVCVFFLLKNIASNKKYPYLLWHYFILGFVGALIFLTRYNNILFALGWPFIFIWMKDLSLKSVESWKGIILSAIAFIGIVVFFKIWPELYNHHHPYPWVMHYLFRSLSLSDILHRLAHMFFGIDWGMIYTVPFIFPGIVAAFLLRYPAKKYLIVILGGLLVNFYVTFTWGCQGSWYGYRYLIASAIPLLVLPIAILFKTIDDKMKKNMLWLWVLIAIPPLLSMVFFESSPKFDLCAVPVDFGEMDYTNYLYQFYVWKVVLFHPLQFLRVFCQGGVEYCQFLFIRVFQHFELFANSFFRNYSQFDLSTFVRGFLVYAVPFMIGWFFKREDNLSIKRKKDAG